MKRKLKSSLWWSCSWTISTQKLQQWTRRDQDRSRGAPSSWWVCVATKSYLWLKATLFSIFLCISYLNPSPTLSEPRGPSISQAVWSYSFRHVSSLSSFTDLSLLLQLRLLKLERHRNNSPLISAWILLTCLAAFCLKRRSLTTLSFWRA